MEDKFNLKKQFLATIVYVTSANNFVFGIWSLWAGDTLNFLAGILLFNFSVFLLIALAKNNPRAILQLLNIEGVLLALILTGIVVEILNGSTLSQEKTKAALVWYISNSIMIWIFLEVVYQNTRGVNSPYKIGGNIIKLV